MWDDYSWHLIARQRAAELRAEGDRERLAAAARTGRRRWRASRRSPAVLAPASSATVAAVDRADRGAATSRLGVPA